MVFPELYVKKTIFFDFKKKRYSTETLRKDAMF